jgi:hypothetical protein
MRRASAWSHPIAVLLAGMLAGLTVPRVAPLPAQGIAAAAVEGTVTDPAGAPVKPPWRTS